MQLSKSISAAMAAVALATAVPVTAAQAGEYRNGPGRGYESHYDRGVLDRGPRRGYDRHDGGRQYGYAPRRYNDRHNSRRRDHTGRNLAIGAFAAIVGIAIAAEASRPRHDDRYDY